MRALCLTARTCRSMLCHNSFFFGSHICTGVCVFVCMFVCWCVDVCMCVCVCVFVHTCAWASEAFEKGGVT